MADVAAENKETPVVEKEVAEEVDAGKKEVTADAPAEEPTTTENGDALASEEKKHSGEAKENGDSEAAAVGKIEADGAAAEAETPAATDAAAEESTPATTEENGVEEPAAEANGDSTDSTPAEAVKRKVIEAEAKTDDAAEVTPEKKAKLDETSKEEVQNGAEASEVAA